MELFKLTEEPIPLKWMMLYHFPFTNYIIQEMPFHICDSRHLFIQKPRKFTHWNDQACTCPWQCPTRCIEILAVPFKRLGNSTVTTQMRRRRRHQHVKWVTLETTQLDFPGHYPWYPSAWHPRTPKWAQFRATHCGICDALANFGWQRLRNGLRLVYSARRKLPNSREISRKSSAISLPTSKDYHFYGASSCSSLFDQKISFF